MTGTKNGSASSCPPIPAIIIKLAKTCMRLRMLKRRLTQIFLGVKGDSWGRCSHRIPSRITGLRRDLVPIVETSHGWTDRERRWPGRFPHGLLIDRFENGDRPGVKKKYKDFVHSLPTPTSLLLFVSYFAAVSSRFWIPDPIFFGWN